MSSPSSKTDFGRQLVRNYELGRRMLASLTEDFSDEDAHVRIEPLKPLVWYLGHIAVAESTLLHLYFDQDHPFSTDHLKKYGRGSDGRADFSDANMGEMLEMLGLLRDRVRAALGTLTYEDMERAPSRQIEHPAFNTLGTASALISAHNAYHAGQIALLRSSLGKGAKFG